MCGICGFIAKKEKITFDCKNTVIQMTETLAHRGPDAAGHLVFNDKGSVIGFGHRRLASRINPPPTNPLSQSGRWSGTNNAWNSAAGYMMSTPPTVSNQPVPARKPPKTG